MKKRIRFTKPLSVSLAAVLLLGCLSACGDTGNTSGKSSQDASSGQSADNQQGKASGSEGSKSESKEEYKYTGVAPVTQEKKTISVLTTNSASRVQDFTNMSWWQDVLKRANVDLNMELVDESSFNDVVSPRLAAGVGLPDLVRLPNTDQDMSYINSGMFQDLTEYYDKLAFNIKKQFENFPDLEGELTTPEGKKFYIPYLYKSDKNYRTFMVNQDWLKQLNMDVPKTIEDMYQMLKAMKGADLNKNNKNDEVPLFVRSATFSVIGAPWGLDLSEMFVVDDKGVVTCSYEQPAYLEFLKYFNKLYSEGLLYSEFSTAGGDVQDALLSNNQIGCNFDWTTNSAEYSHTINPDWKMEKDAPILLPINPLKGPYEKTCYIGRTNFGKFFGISRDCKDPELVFAFSDYLFSEEVSRQTWWGTEGVDYTMENGEPKFSAAFLADADGYKGKNGFNFDGLPSMQFEKVEATQHPDVAKAMENSVSFIKGQIPFSFALPEEISTIQAYKADLKTYCGEMRVGFITGTESLDEWDKYLQTLKAMHVDDLVKIYQAQIDRKRNK